MSKLQLIFGQRPESLTALAICEDLLRRLANGFYGPRDFFFYLDETMKTLELVSDLRNQIGLSIFKIGKATLPLTIACMSFNAATAQDEATEIAIPVAGQDQIQAVPGLSNLVEDLKAAASDQAQTPETPLIDPTAIPDEAPARNVLKVDDSLAGWNTADASNPFKLGPELRRSWVMADDEGKIYGDVFAPELEFEGCSVFFIRDGLLVEKVDLNENGQFVAFGLEEGVYTAMVTGSGRYAINCLVVLRHNALSSTPSSFSIPLTEASSRTVYDLVTDRATKVRFRNFGEFAFGETAEDPARLFGISGISVHKPKSVEATTMGNVQVNLSAEGNLIGRMRAIERNSGRPIDLQVTEVFVIQNNELVQSTQTNRYGIFEFGGLPSGYYTLVAASKDGVAVTGFEAVGGTPALAGENMDAIRTSTRRSNALVVNALDVTLSPRRDIGWVNTYLRDNVPPPIEAPLEDIVSDPYGNGFGDRSGYGQGMPCPGTMPCGQGNGCDPTQSACGCETHATRGCPLLGRLKHQSGCGCGCN